MGCPGFHFLERQKQYKYLREGAVGRLGRTTGRTPTGREAAKRRHLWLS